MCRAILCRGLPIPRIIPPGIESCRQVLGGYEPELKETFPEIFQALNPLIAVDCQSAARPPPPKKKNVLYHSDQPGGGLVDDKKSWCRF